VFSASAEWQGGGAPAEGASTTLAVTVAVQVGWHVNSNVPLEDYLVPTTVRLDLPPGWTAEPAVFPPHREARFAFSETPLAVFEGMFTVTIRGRVAAAALPESIGAPSRLGCSDKMCLTTECRYRRDRRHRRSDDSDIGSGACRRRVPSARRTRKRRCLSAAFLRGGKHSRDRLPRRPGLNLTPCVPADPDHDRVLPRLKTSALALISYAGGMVLMYSALGVVPLTGSLFGPRYGQCGSSAASCCSFWSWPP
jgi:hypothetical protein